MTKDEALKLALEALEGFIPYLQLKDETQCNRYDKAINAIKEALAQPEQEPVATLNIGRFKNHLANHDFEYFGDLPDGTHSLYTAPQQHPWVGLTDEKRSELVTLHHGWNAYGQAIEAKLKEKNT